MTNSPTEMLEAEHRFIAKVVSAAGLLADKLEAGQPVEAQVFQNVVVRVHAVERRRRRVCFVEVTQVVVDEMMQRFG